MLFEIDAIYYYLLIGCPISSFIGWLFIAGNLKSEHEGKGIPVIGGLLGCIIFLLIVIALKN